jgi:hypothetical protein
MKNLLTTLATILSVVVLSTVNAKADCHDIEAAFAEHPYSNYTISVSGTTVSVAPTVQGPIKNLASILDKNREVFARAGCTEVLLKDRKGKMFQRFDLTPVPLTPAQITALTTLPATKALNEFVDGELHDKPDQVEAPTAENYQRIVESDVGFFRRRLAVIKDLQDWYEVDPNHPDAIALKREFCGNAQQQLDRIRHYLAYIGYKPVDVERQKFIEAFWQANEELAGKNARLRDLFEQSTSALNELEGMGFSCQ